MNRAVKAAFWAIPPILLLVVLPRLLVSYLPPVIVKDANSLVGLNIPLIVSNLTVFGIVLAALSAVQSWFDDWSLVKLAASSLHMLTTYVLLLFFLGWGIRGRSAPPTYRSPSPRLARPPESGPSTLRSSRPSSQSCRGWRAL